MRVLFSLLFVGVGVASAADAPATFPVTVASDIKYRTDSDAVTGRNILDVYVPKGAKDYPVLFLVHGGTWQHGSKDYFKQVGTAFAKRGIGVVCPNYRLSPKVKHPAHIEDVAKAFAWTVDTIAKHGGDPKKIVVAGHSAGGHLASLLATDAKYLKAEKKSVADIKGVIGISGVYTIPPVLFDSIFGSDAKECKAASPTEHVNKSCPPCVLIYGDKDLPFLDAMANDLGKKWTGAKCDAEICEIKGRDHITVMYDVGKPADAVFEKMETAVRKWTK
jgi:acetyl esterase/lipase